MNPTQLDASLRASGPHVFAVRSRTVRYRHYQRPPRPVPTIVTIMIRPSGGTGWRRCITEFISGKAKYFLFRGLTPIPKIGSDLPVGLICRMLNARLRLRGDQRVDWVSRVGRVLFNPPTRNRAAG